MKKSEANDLRRRLFEEFEFLRPKGTIQTDGMFFGLQHGDGWLPILYDLCSEIKGAIEFNPERYKDFKAYQVKEKWGGLRFYCTYEGEVYIAERIAVAEWRAEHTCERCGRPGTLRQYGWHQTRCDWHEFVYRAQRVWWRIGGYRLYGLRGRWWRWVCRRGWHDWYMWKDGTTTCHRCLVKKGGETEE